MKFSRVIVFNEHMKSQVSFWFVIRLGILTVNAKGDPPYCHGTRSVNLPLCTDKVNTGKMSLVDDFGKFSRGV